MSRCCCFVTTLTTTLSKASHIGHRKRRRRRRGLRAAVVSSSARAKSLGEEEDKEEENSWNGLELDDHLKEEKKTNEQHYAFVGTEKLYGHANVSKLENTHVVIIGIGGIGSWCAEALARTSIGEFTLIDLDFICVTNINRQTMAM